MTRYFCFFILLVSSVSKIFCADISVDENLAGKSEKEASQVELKLIKPKPNQDNFFLEITPLNKDLKCISINVLAFGDHHACIGFSKKIRSEKNISRSYAMISSHKPPPQYATYSFESGKILLDLDYVTYCIFVDIESQQVDLAKCDDIGIMLGFSGLFEGMDKNTMIYTNRINLSPEEVMAMITNFQKKKIVVEDPYLKFIRERSTQLEAKSLEP